MQKIPNFKKYQKKERVLSVALLSVAAMAPITMTLMMEKKIHWMLSGSVGFAVLMASLWISLYKNRLEQKLKAELESLDIGHILASKSKATNRFVITNTGYDHYYIKSLDNGEQMLISRRRAIEDFDLAL